MDLVILNLAVLGAAFVQAATGIGFGALAGPVLLLTLGSAAAVQITVVLSLLIALVLSTNGESSARPSPRVAPVSRIVRLWRVFMGKSVARG